MTMNNGLEGGSGRIYILKILFVKYFEKFWVINVSSPKERKKKMIKEKEIQDGRLRAESS